MEYQSLEEKRKNQETKGKDGKKDIKKKSNYETTERELSAMISHRGKRGSGVRKSFQKGVRCQLPDISKSRENNIQKNWAHFIISTLLITPAVQKSRGERKVQSGKVTSEW